MSFNLHRIVRKAIYLNLADEDVDLIQSSGQTLSRGRAVATYLPAVRVRAQVQTLSGDDLQVMGETERTERDRKFYLYSDRGPRQAVAGQNRQAGRTGDYIYRPATGTYWKIYNIAEDFSAAGWVQALASEQVQVPQGVIDARA